MSRLQAEGGATQVSLGTKLRDVIASERLPWIAAALGGLLALPSLRLGLLTDDENFRYLVLHDANPFTMFSIYRDRLAENLARGELSWWTNPDLSLRFFRPLSSWLHYVEYRYYPNAAWLMHFWNVALYVALIWVAARAYRELLPNRLVAGLAALMYAVDDAHAQAVGWISSRNTVAASLFGLLAFTAHVRARRTGVRKHTLASLGWLGLGLLCGESAVGSLAYLLAYCAIYESGALRERCRTILPQLALFAVWALVYIAGGFGARGLSFYRGFDEPGALLGQGLADLPLLVESLLGVSLVSAVGPLSSAATRIAALVIVLPLAAAVYRRSSWSQPVRFFALGAALSLPPLFATVAQDRILILAGFGAFAVIADVLWTAADRTGAGAWATRTALVSCHWVIAPLLFVPMLGAIRPVGLAAQKLSDQLVSTPGHSHVLLNAPFELIPIYALTHHYNALGHDAGPVQLLYVGEGTLELTRPDAQTLEVSVAQGWGTKPFERIFTARSRMPALGETRTYGDRQIEVLEINASGLPSRVRFRFSTPLDAATRHWLVWSGSRALPWTVPAVGERATVPGLDFFTSLPR